MPVIGEEGGVPKIGEGVEVPAIGEGEGENCAEKRDGRQKREWGTSTLVVGEGGGGVSVSIVMWHGCA